MNSAAHSVVFCLRQSNFGREKAMLLTPHFILHRHKCGGSATNVFVEPIILVSMEYKLWCQNAVLVALLFHCSQMGFQLPGMEKLHIVVAYITLWVPHTRVMISHVIIPHVTQNRTDRGSI